VKTGKLQHSKAANRVGVVRGRQRRAWTWSGGCDGNDMRGGVCSAAYLPKQRGKMGRRWGQLDGFSAEAGVTWRGGVGSDSSTTRTRRRRAALPLGPETGVCVGCAWRTWAGGFGLAREHCAVSDLIQYFQTELNLIQLKDGPPKLEKFQIKYVLEGILIGNNFPYRIFFQNSS
jgi:hypothetical protein